MDRIVIIGAGECGVRAAFSLREQGFDGEVVMLSAEHSVPYERPPLSKHSGGEPKLIKARDDYLREGLQLQLGISAKDINLKAHEVRCTAGNSVHYDRLLLATGARARILPELESCLTLRTDRDAQQILARAKPGSRLGVIGGGFIGLELASTAREMGASVTVFEAGPRVLARAVPAEIAELIHDRHISAGVEIRTSAKIKSACKTTLETEDDGVEHFDLLVAGIGAVPNTELAISAGLLVENGIVVDRDFRTSDPNIFAAGDCCNFVWRDKRHRLESWKAAQDQGSFVAAAMMGSHDQYDKVPWFWSDQFDLTLQVAGIFDREAPVIRRRLSDGAQIVLQCGADQVITAAAGIGEGLSVSKDMKVIERLIERQTAVVAEQLMDVSFNLKQLLRVA